LRSLLEVDSRLTSDSKSICDSLISFSQTHGYDDEYDDEETTISSLADPENTS